MFWLKPNSHYTTNDGKLYGEFYADTAEDLATSLDGVDIEKGSIAYVIASGKFYVLNSSGEWINSDSGSAQSFDLTQESEDEEKEATE